ncbi:MAG: hypothetical protein JO180_11840 [Gemmatirosa sp.]|nr:hypothetical protein [Gemmatirosa sp.]
MTATDRHLVRATWAALAGAADRLAAHFYDRLFDLDPSLRLLYLGADLVAHGRALMHAVGVAVANLERLDALVPRAETAGATPPGLVGEALVWAVECTLGPAACTPAVRIAWARCGALVAASQRRPPAAAARVA